LGTVTRRPRRRIARLQVEGLEWRSLLSVTINEFPVPTTGSDPTDIATGPDGDLWFTESLGNKIGQINPSTHAIAEFPVPTVDSEPTGITAGPDGDLWFTEFNGNAIGQINPTTHAIAEFAVPSTLAQPREITSGPDGNLWFTEETSNKIGRINPTTGAINEFPIPTAGSPLGITAGPDGDLWFAEGAGNNIGRINPTTGAINEFPIPTAGSLSFGITTGPDGNVWFTEENGNKIGQVNPTTHVIAEFPVPTAGSALSHITAGSDGNLWFAERAAGRIGMINPTTHSVVEFSTPTANRFPLGIAAGPDGNLWFTELGGKIGQAIVTAQATAPDLALAVNAPGSVTLGSNVTYTLSVTNNGTAGATGVTLTDNLPAGVTFVSATDGVQPVADVLTFAIGNLDAGANAGFTIVVTPAAAGILSDKASVSANQSDPTTADNSVTRTTTVASAGVEGPTVTGVERFGFHERPTTLVLTFDEPLDPGRAQNLANYRIVALGGSRRTIRIKKAVYDAATRTVTLSLVHRLSLHHRFRLTVVGTGSSGVTDISGNPLNGQTTGDPGSNFVTIVTARDLVLTTSDPAIVWAYNKIVASEG
jgi:uncharacterized repeat protein (TIGR01451 family)